MWRRTTGFYCPGGTGYSPPRWVSTTIFCWPPWRSREDSNLQAEVTLRPPAFQAGRLPIIALLQIARQNYFHTISSLPTAQGAGIPGSTLRMLLWRQGWDSNPQTISQAVGFRDRVATITAPCHVAKREGLEPSNPIYRGQTD